MLAHGGLLEYIKLDVVFHTKGQDFKPESVMIHLLFQKVALAP